MNLAYKEVIINQIQLLFPSMPFFKCNRDNWEKKNKQYLDCIRIIDNLETVKAIPLDKVKQAREDIDAQCGRRGLDDYDYCSGLIFARNVLDKLIESEG